MKKKKRGSGPITNFFFVLSRSCRFLQNDHQKSEEIKSTLETGNAVREILQVIEALAVKETRKKKKKERWQVLQICLNSWIVQVHLCIYLPNQNSLHFQVLLWPPSIKTLIENYSLVWRKPGQNRAQGMECWPERGHVHQDTQRGVYGMLTGATLDKLFALKA